MALTIDHLAPGTAVRVLREFTDLRGTTVPAGDHGLIQQLGFNPDDREIIFEWEHAGGRETLRFPGHKTDRSPSNGNMRAFFEIVSKPERRDSATPPPTTTMPMGGQDGHEMPLARQRAVQPPNNTNLRELRVACQCDPRLHRPVMTFLLEVTVHACLRCGTITGTKCIGDDGRFTGDSWHAHLTVAIPESALAWIAGWPCAQTVPCSAVRWPSGSALERQQHNYLP